MNLLKYFAIFIFAFLITSAVTVAQIPIPFPANDGTKSYYVTGGGGVKIFVDEKGDPTKTAIIFSTGYSTSRTSWDPQWYDPKLYKNFHLVRYDYRGMGNSDKPIDVNSYSLDLNADDLFAVISNLFSKHNFNKKKKIVLIGWSIGTPISLAFMKNYPDVKIHGLVLVCGFVNSTKLFNEKFTPFLEALADPQENFDKLVYGFNGLFKLVSFKPLSDEVNSFFLGNAVLGPSGYRKFLFTDPIDLSVFYSSLTLPTLHIIGEKDIIVGIEHSLYFASLRKDSKSIIYKDVGHNPLWENIKELNKDIVKFVGKI